MVRADGCLVLEGLLCSWLGIGCFRHRILACFTFFVVAVGHVRHQHHSSECDAILHQCNGHDDAGHQNNDQ